MVIIKVGSEYSLVFDIRNTTANVANGVVALFTYDDTKLALTTITGGGVQNGDEYTMGTLLGNTLVPITATFEVLQEVQLLAVTCTVSTTSPETNLSDNDVTVNLVQELGGILCSEIQSCGATIVDWANLPLYYSEAEARDDIGENQWFRYYTSNTDSVPSPNNNTPSLTGLNP